MNRREFLDRIEEVRPYTHGSGQEIADMCNMNLSKYQNAISGKIKNSDTLQQISDAIDLWLAAKLIKIQKVLVPKQG